MDEIRSRRKLNIGEMLPWGGKQSAHDGSRVGALDSVDT